MAKNIEININNGSNSYETLYPKTLGSLIEGNVSGANTANTLATARTIQTNLGSTSASSFNGSSNITPGVSGILSASNGGTGYNSLYNLAHYGLKNELNLIAYTGSRKGDNTIPSDSSPLNYIIRFPNTITPLFFYMSYEAEVNISPVSFSKNNVTSDGIIGYTFNNIAVFINKDSGVHSSSLGLYENDSGVFSKVVCGMSYNDSSIYFEFRKDTSRNVNVAPYATIYLNSSYLTYYWTVVGIIA